jgi:hypothetical protein
MLQKLELVRGEGDRTILKRFYEHMLSKNHKSEHHVNSLLTLLISLDKFYNIPFTSISTKEKILTFLNHQYMDGRWVERERDPEDVSNFSEAIGKPIPSNNTGLLERAIALTHLRNLSQALEIVNPILKGDPTNLHCSEHKGADLVISRKPAGTTLIAAKSEVRLMTHFNISLNPNGFFNDWKNWCSKHAVDCVQNFTIGDFPEMIVKVHEQYLAGVKAAIGENAAFCRRWDSNNDDYGGQDCSDNYNSYTGPWVVPSMS